MSDKYAKALERALFNWYNGGEGADTEPIFNALSQGRKGKMQLFVPIETPETLLQQLMEAGELKEGTKFSMDEGFSITFKHIPVDEEGHYLIALFTCEAELELGEESLAVSQSFDVLLDCLDQWEECVGYVINPYTNKILVDRNIREKIKGYDAKSHLSFVRGSVLDMKVGAVVNSAHNTLLGGKAVDEILLADGEMDEMFLCGGGLNGAVHEAAGEELFKECKSLGGCDVGDVKVTDAYGIKNADYIIHAVGPVYPGEDNDTGEGEQLASCYKKALDAAAERGCDSVAFPCISAGARRYPAGKVGQTALIAVIEWFETHPDIILNVYFCCFTEAEYKTYFRMIKQ